MVNSRKFLACGLMNKKNHKPKGCNGSRLHRRDFDIRFHINAGPAHFKIVNSDYFSYILLLSLKRESHSKLS